MITKLLLVRTQNSRSTLLDESGVSQYASKPVNVSPLSWRDEDGLTHYGFELKNVSLEDWQNLQNWAHTQDGVSVQEHEGNIVDSLAAIGLRINASAKAA